MQPRPTGVTILGVLEIVSGVLNLIGGGCVGALALLNLGGALAGTATGTPGADATSVAVGIGVVAGILTLVSVALAIAAIIIGVGLLQLKQWAYRIALVLAFISIVVNVINVITILANGDNIGQALAGNGLPLIINGAIVYYLNQVNVKKAFGV